MYNGILPVYKEKGYTSFDVVACLRKILDQKKIGHTGTLDPDACGVLPVCLGNATKIVQRLTDSGKQYRAQMILGVRTDTQDISGNVLSEVPPEKDTEKIKNVLLSFIGEYEQTPPMYSALKVNGKKLCDLARQGIEIERKSRKVKIYDIIVHDIDYDIVDFTVDCSKGTYIRTLIDDVGGKLGCGACMKELLRLKSGGFELNDCFRLEEIKRAVEDSDIDKMIISTDKFFSVYPKLTVSEEYNKLLYNGNSLFKNMFSEWLDENAEMYRVYDSYGCFVGIYTYEVGKFKLRYFFGRN